MKKYYALLLISAAIFTACKKSPEPAIDPPVVVKPTEPTVKPPVSKSQKIDSLRKLVAKRSTLYTALSDSIWADSTGITFRIKVAKELTSTDFSMQPSLEDRIYLGSVLKGNSILNLKYDPITGYKQVPLILYFSSPAFNIIPNNEMPSLAATNKYINTVLASSKPRQVDQFRFSNGNPFENYSEISIDTETSWDFSKLVISKPGDHGHIKKKNGLYSSYRLDLFTVYADHSSVDGSFFAPGVDVKTIPNEPVTVIGVTYGRTAVIAIESDADFKQIKAAFQATIDKNATDADQKLLREATITTYLLGFNKNDTEAIKTSQGYDRVNLFTKTISTGGTFSSTDYGAITKFTCIRADDFSMIKEGFTYRLDYPVK